MNYSETTYFLDPQVGDRVEILRNSGRNLYIDDTTGAEWRYEQGKVGVVLGSSWWSDNYFKVRYLDHNGEHQTKTFHRFAIKVTERI